MNVYQVKKVINRTDCVDHIFSGFYCSEPIMSRDESGLIIDNYIIYTRTDDCSQISSPKCIFGINSEKEESVYINDSISDEFKERFYPEEFENEEIMKDAMKLYLELFPVVRNMYKLNHNIDLQIVRKYVEALKRISGNTLFDFYKQLFPEFFEWAKVL